MEAAGDRSVCPSPATGSSSKLLRYPLRSAAKSKESKPQLANADASVASAPKRGRPSSSVSKSISALDLSGKDKSAKPPRRVSITDKAASPHDGSMSPISESRTMISKDQGKNVTPLSNVSKSISRKRFSVISSVSYWLSQIKLSESALKHSISLGLFKLALEAGCEPLDRLREELKSYIKRHNLVAELGEFVKDLLESYNILDDLEKLSVSETPSNSVTGGVKKSVKVAHSSSPTARTRNLKPKSLNSDTLAVVTNMNDKDISQKRQPISKSKGADKKTDANSVSSKVTNNNNKKKKPQKPSPESNDSPSKEYGEETGDAANPCPTKEGSQDKENMEGHSTEGDNIAQEIQTVDQPQV